MTIDEVKKFLVIEDDYDDDLIASTMSAAEAFIASAVGDITEEMLEENPALKAKYDQLYKAITQDLYDHRDLMQSVARQRMGNVYRSLILQLQLEYEILIDEEDTNELSGEEL